MFTIPTHIPQSNIYKTTMMCKLFKSYTGLTMLSILCISILSLVGNMFSLSTTNIRGSKTPDLVSDDIISSIHAKRPPASKEEKLNRVMIKALNGEYPGDKRVKENGDPVWNQRTSFLYYSRVSVGAPLIWMTLALGFVSNPISLISDKKKSIETWKSYDPVKYAELDPHIPHTWSDSKSFGEDVDESIIYVLKPTGGAAGRGISFKKGGDIYNDLVENEKNDPPGTWVVQEFVNPFLYENRKTHFRVLSLVIVQPDGSREFHMYRRMRMFLAEEEFSEERLLSGEDIYYMMMTNMNQSQERFLENPENESSDFEWGRYIKDVETSFRLLDGEISFEDVHEEISNLHSKMYSTFGDLFQCRGTEVSLFDNACFHIIASDVALDKTGKPFLIEMNMSMGIKNLWNRNEISNFSNGAAALINAPGFPYKVEKTNMWSKINIV